MFAVRFSRSDSVYLFPVDECAEHGSSLYSGPLTKSIIPRDKTDLTDLIPVLLDGNDAHSCGDDDTMHMS